MNNILRTVRYYVNSNSNRVPDDKCSLDSQIFKKQCLYKQCSLCVTQELQQRKNVWFWLICIFVRSFRKINK